MNENGIWMTEEYPVRMQTDWVGELDLVTREGELIRLNIKVYQFLG